jgi:DNA-binding response OmpR family regulator
MPRLLVVDDDEAFHRLVRRALEDSFEIIEANDGLEALKTALNLSPDCILLDLMLPEIGGLVLCETLKHLRKTQTIPIVMISGRDTEENRRIALESGAVDFLGKPIDFAGLHSTIMDAIRGHPLERRKNQRLPLTIPVRIEIESRKGPVLVHTMTEDISVSGMRFSTAEPIQVGDPIQVHILTGVPGASPVYGASGQVAWVEDRYAPLLRCGAQLTEASESWKVKSQIQ